MPLRAAFCRLREVSLESDSAPLRISAGAVWCTGAELGETVGTRRKVGSGPSGQSGSVPPQAPWIGRSRRFNIFCRRGLLCGMILAPLALGSCVFADELQQQSTKQTKAATTQNYNLRLRQLAAQNDASGARANDYRIGANDLLEVSVYNAPDLNRTVRVAADGIVALPLVGDVEASGLTIKELDSRIETLLRENYMTDPQVDVFVKEIQSHPVSVFGAVGRPGVYQIQEPESLIQVLSLAQGLADDAGDKVIVMRRNGGAEQDAAGATEAHLADSGDSLRLATNPEPLGSPQHPPQSIEVDLRKLLTSAGSDSNVEVYPGDVVKVPPAGIVYVVGEVHKPGGFLLRTNENISVLQALALAEGTTSTSSQKSARIIRTETSGDKKEIRIDLKRILEGKAADPVLQPKDILFVPNSAGKSAFYRGAEAALSITGGLIVYPFKTLGGIGDGGAVTTNDPEIAQAIRRMRYNGEDRTTGEYHFHGATALLDNVNAAVLKAKLAHVENWIAHRRRTASLYREGLCGIPQLHLPHFDESNQCDVFQNYVIRAVDRDAVRQHLASDGVETLIHWPKPVWRHAALGLADPCLPNTEKLCHEVLSLPINAETTARQVEIVIESIRSFYAQKQAHARA